MLYLHGIGHCHPTNEITNTFLEDLAIDTNDEWIMQRTGIRCRRTVLDLEYIRQTKNSDVRGAAEAATISNAELGRRAAEMALARAGVERQQLGMVIGGGSVPDTVTPAEGCNIAAALAIEVPSFDVRSACTSFAAALYLLESMNPERLPDFVLLATPETVTRSVNYADRRAAVIWGDGAAAAVLSKKVPSRVSVHCRSITSSPKGCDKVVVPWTGHFEQDGAAVQAFAIKTTVRLLKGLQKDCPPERFFFIGHQANLRMLQSVTRACSISEEKHLYNVVDYGNTATAGAPSVISMHWDEFKPGDTIGVVGVGGGLTWTDTLIRFEG